MTKTKIQKVYGPPGTGKTTFCIKYVKELLEQGVDIDNIAYLSFTNAAAGEALKRAAQTVSDLSKDKRYYFRTLHSLGNWRLHFHDYYEDRKIMNWTHERAFCIEVGIPPPNRSDSIMEGSSGVSPGTAFFATYSYLINTFKDPESYQECPHAQSLGAFDYPKLHEKYEDWKSRNKYIDFSDMLSEMYAYGINIPVEYLIVDEYQDNSPLQDAIVHNLIQDKKRVLIAGDDDQALYEFQGADPSLMNNVKADEVLVLGKSWRCYGEILNPALNLINQNVNRQPKKVVPKGQGGKLLTLKPWDMSEVLAAINANSNYGGLRTTIYMLARTNNLVNKIGWALAKNRILYRYISSEEERKFGWNKTRTKLMNEILANPPSYRRLTFSRIAAREGWSDGTKGFLSYYLDKPYINPQEITLKIGTIHSAKGREADTVVVFNDISEKVLNGMISEAGMESERRVWYVGMTRAINTLVLVDGMFRTGAKFPLLQSIEGPNSNLYTQ